MVKQRRTKKKPKRGQGNAVKRSRPGDMVAIERPETHARVPLIVVPGFPADDPRSRVPQSPQGTPGVYTVTFVLAVPGKNSFQDNLDTVRLMVSGDSLLHFQKGATIKIDVWNDQERGEVLFSTNVAGVISTARVRVEAVNFVEAERAGHNLVLPILSYLSYRYDVALEVNGYEVTHEHTQARKWVFGLIGQVKQFTLDQQQPFESTKGYRHLLSAYREGMNATNVFYQVLSFYKVIEGIRRHRAARREQARVEGSEMPREPSERFPDQLDDLAIDDEEIRERFKPYLAKKFTWAQDHFRTLIRNAVAHLDPTGEILDADDFDDVRVCERAVPILRYMARQMLASELTPARD
jgi:hypothetical protein